MKKLWLMLAMMLCVFASCSDGGSDNPVNPTPKPEEVKTEITIDSGIISNGLSFASSQGEQSIFFSVNADWMLSVASTTSGATWCKASATNGGKGSANVKFTFDENTSYDDRSVSVTIKAGTVSKTFTITQKGADAMLVTTTKYEVAQEGGKIEVEVKANIDYQFTISETAKDWIAEAKSKSRGLTTYKHTFEIAMNEEAEKREGEITIKSGDKVETVKVYQAGGAVLLLSKNEFTVSDAGETISVDIKSNVEYDVQMPDVDWIKDEASNRGMSSHTLKYVIAPNEGYDSRSAEIIFYDQNSDLKDTLKVIQAQKDAIVISDKNISVDKEGGTIEVKLSTNIDFEVEIPSDATWISQTKSRALVEKSFYLKISENTSDESRSANITITNKDSQVSDSIVIVQQGNIIVAKLNEAGTLKSTLGKDYLNINSLKIVGPINEDDVYYLRKMLGNNEFSEADWGKLTNLDLSETTIVEKWGIPSPDDVIEASMFRNCKNLQNIVLPNSVVSIFDGAFRGCSSLTSVIIPENVIRIKNLVFEGCSSLTSVTIPNSVTEMGMCIFAGCSSLKSVTIGNNVTKIDREAFKDCSSLASITIPNSVSEIIDKAFYNCSSLTSAIIGNSVISIAESAFEGCSALTSVTIPNCVTEIGNKVFYGCSSLTSATIGDSVITIAIGAFEGCSSLTSVIIGGNVSTISDNAFSGCSALTTVTIPNSVTKIGNKAFNGCSSLASATIGENVIVIAESAFEGCSALTSAIIPNSVIEIGFRAFFGCPSLTSVTIGDSVTKIGQHAFRGNSKLEVCYCYAKEVPHVYPDTFANIKTEATLYVPAKCGTKYKSSKWNEYFKNIIEMD